MIIKKIIFLILFKLQTAYHVKIQRIHWRMYKKLKKNMNKNIEFPQEERWENENIVKRVKKWRE